MMDMALSRPIVTGVIMNHVFNVDVAKEYGILEAVLLNNFAFWVAKNQANERHFHDGKYWTYNSTKAFSELFPYATPKQIRNALDHLKDEGLVETANYNEQKFDRTLWYTLTPKGFSICLDGQNHLPCGANAFDSEGKPIPDINPSLLPDDKPYSIGQKRKRFVRPTLDEVKEYCIERKNNVDPQKFFDHYEANGWKVGKNSMKDWKAAVRYWERSGYNGKKVGPNGIVLNPDADDDLDGVF